MNNWNHKQLINNNNTNERKDMRPYEHDYSAIVNILLKSGIVADIDDGVNDGTPGVFTLNLDGGDIGALNTALEDAGFRIIEDSANVGAPGAWIICERAPQKMAGEKEDEINDLVRTNSGKRFADIGGEFFAAKTIENASMICLCGETFEETHEPQVEVRGGEVVWTTTYRAVNRTEDGSHLQLQVFFRATETFVDGDDDEREHLVACGEQCDWDTPFIW